MNSETLISQANYAIDMFKIDHVGSCCLRIRNGFVTAVPAGEASQRTPSCLFLTRTQQKRGLTISQWTVIGKVLLKIYNKEKSCHPRLKH